MDIEMKVQHCCYSSSLALFIFSFGLKFGIDSGLILEGFFFRGFISGGIATFVKDIFRVDFWEKLLKGFETEDLIRLLVLQNFGLKIILQ